MHPFEKETIDKVIEGIASKKEAREVAMWFSETVEGRHKRMRKIYWQAAAVLIPVIMILGITFQLNNQVNLFGKTVYAEVYVPKGKQEH
ncbi:MAG: FecR/PupR family, partial [Bacteroidetes bacterium]|nr:FecR/PupR family [Bacteroidota bacterium]